MAGEDMIQSTRHQGSQEVYSFEFAVHENMQWRYRWCYQLSVIKTVMDSKIRRGLLKIWNVKDLTRSSCSDSFESQDFK